MKFLLVSLLLILGGCSQVQYPTVTDRVRAECAARGATVTSASAYKYAPEYTFKVYCSDGVEISGTIEIEKESR